MVKQGSKKILITGSQGFIGSRLLPALQQVGHSVSGPELDLFDAASVDRAVGSGNWDTVIHLAGLSDVPTCEKDPEKAYRTNLNGTALVLESLRKHAPQAHLIFASTAHVYTGAQIDSSAWDESRPVIPQNTYARTKRAAEVLILEAFRRKETQPTILRLFNHTHHSQPSVAFLAHIYTQLKGQTPGTKITIPVGNLDLYRDIGTVRDLLEAFARAVDLPETTRGEIFNIASGSSKHLATLARELANRMGVNAEFVVDPSRLRAGEPKEILGSCEKFSKVTGWKPECDSVRALISGFLA